MVYRGRPSDACFSCRQRRIKCDKKRPGCMQCSNMSIECLGYRDLSDLCFRNENDSVIRKAQASYGKPNVPRRRRPRSGLCPPEALKPSTPDEHSSPDSASYCEDMTTPAIWPSLTQAVGDVGVTFFMSSYIPGSHFNYLPYLYSQEKLAGPLHTVIIAAAMASLAQDLEDHGLMKAARVWYTTGLALTNTALEDNVTAIQDSTLVAILLLSLFEAIVWERPHTPNNWTVHTHGALALVRLRGHQQFETDLGRLLFYQVTNNIRVSCIQQRKHLPPAFSSLMSSAKPFYEADNPKIALAALLGELAELLADIDGACMGAFEITKAAMQLERKYNRLVRRLPPAWQYTETYVEGQADVCGATIHEYPNHRVAQLWNSYRMVRILLNEIVYASTESAASPAATYLVENPSKNSLHLQAASNIAEMSYDICASVPHLTSPSSSSTTWKACANSLLWPLSAVKGASLAPEPARLYAVERLRYLGDELKLPQAVRIANETRDELKELQNGLHMFYLS